jgi:hypothetical protein
VVDGELAGDLPDHPQAVAVLGRPRCLLARTGFLVSAGGGNLFKWWDWPAGFLVLAACACLAAGIAASGVAATTFAGAGAALAGAAAARIGDLFSESRATAQIDKALRSTDLDESRRLAYMALMSKGTGDYGLAASLLNALVYHQQKATEEDAMKHLRALASSKDCDDSEEWLRGHIRRINAEREALAGTS